MQSPPARAGVTDRSGSNAAKPQVVRVIGHSTRNALISISTPTSLVKIIVGNYWQGEVGNQAQKSWSVQNQTLSIEDLRVGVDCRWDTYVSTTSSSTSSSSEPLWKKGVDTLKHINMRYVAIYDRVFSKCWTINKGVTKGDISLAMFDCHSSLWSVLSWELFTYVLHLHWLYHLLWRVDILTNIPLRQTCW